MYMLDHMDQTFKNAGIAKLQKQMDSKRKPHPQAEAEEMEMMDEPAPKKKSVKKGAMDDEFDLMGGKPKDEAPPVEVANIETKAEDQQVEEDQTIKKKKKKHHKKKKDSVLVQESMETMTFEQKIKNLLKNDKDDAKKKIEDFTDKICLPQLINLPELKDDRDLIPYICFYDGLNLLKSKDDSI